MSNEKRGWWVDGGGIYLFLLWRVKHFRALGDLNLMEKKRFFDDPRIEEEKVGPILFFFFASVRFPMRLVLTRTQGARSRRLCLLLPPYIYIYTLPPIEMCLIDTYSRESKVGVWEGRKQDIGGWWGGQESSPPNSPFPTLTRQ